MYKSSWSRLPQLCGKQTDQGSIGLGRDPLWWLRILEGDFLALSVAKY